MLQHSCGNNLVYSRRGEGKLSRMVAFSVSFHLIIIMALVVVSLISNKTTHIYDASYVTLVTVPKEVVSNQPVIRPSVSGNVEREKKTGVERDRSQTSQKEISRKISPADTKQKDGLNDWWKKNKESLTASNDTKARAKLTVPPPTIPKAQDKASQETERPQAQEKSEGLNDWWKKNKESLTASNNTKAQAKLTVPPPTVPKAQDKASLQETERPQPQEKSEGLNDWWKKNKESLTASNNTKAQAKLTVPPPTVPKAQDKASLQETERPQPQEKSEGLNDWWKKNKEFVEEGSKRDQTPEKTSQAEDKVALNNPNPGNVGIKIDNLSTGFPPIYFESIKNKIQRYWFPTSNLMTVVAFNIKPSGEVAGLQVEKGSGDSFFDRSAIRAVMDSTPLPPFPEGFKEKDLRVHFTFIGEAIR